MGADKGGTKSGGFFHLFDWNRRSRKKLFSNGSVSPESRKQEKRSEDNLPASRLRLVDDDEVAGVSSRKGSSDYSCASSVTDEEGLALRAPGVVARLMGLDSMPTSVVAEPSSTPLFDTRSLRDKQSHKASPELYIKDQFNHIVHRADGYARRPMEMRAQKTPSSPIERFQTETLPPRSAKSLPMTHHKLLSPIKNPAFVSTRNAAHIMEAAAKILDPGGQPSTRAKVSSFSPSSIPLIVGDSKENMVVSQSKRTSRIQESARTHVDSTDFRNLRGQPLNRSWNGQEDTSVLRRSPNVNDPNPADIKGKGKSISLAIQAKVNVQRREGLTSSSRNSSAQKDQEECSFGQPFKSQSNHQKNKQQKKPSAASASGVLRQNNLKQNCMSSKGKLSSKQMTTHHGRKVLSGDTSSARTRTLSKLSGNSRVGQMKECTEGTDFEREGSSSSNKDFPQKKRLIERGFISQKSGFIDNILDRHQKHVQPNVIIDEHSRSRWKEDNRSDGADVVSFTFTSPLIKPMSASRFSTQAVENSNKGNMYCFDTHNQKKDLDANDKKRSSHGLNVISGDTLNLLLEQKLRELTSGMEPSYGSITNDDSFTVPSPVSQGPASDITTDTGTVEHEMVFHLTSCRDEPGSVFGFGISSINGQVYGASKLQGGEERSINSDARKELDQEHASPFSILEASFSNESHNMSESSDSTDGTKTCSSSIQAQNNPPSFNSVNGGGDVELLSDSATSTLTENSDVSGLSKASRAKASDEDVAYVKEILLNSDLPHSVLAGDSADHHLLFNELEDKRKGEEKDGRLRRRVLFDCVGECLDSRCSRYFRSGYRSWCRGAAVVEGKESLAREVYDEISGWVSMGDWMVDELVDRDMSSSSKLGRWVDYDIEAFEAGVDVERGIVNSLVDELIADFL